MTTINNLSTTDTLAAGDLVPVFSTTNGDARKASMTTLATYVQNNISLSDDKLTQYASPSASPFTTAVTDSSESVWLILTPTGTMASGTITLPALASCVDKQEVLVNTTQAVTSLTVAGNGATVTGAPTTLAIGDYFRLRFDSVGSTWYRVG